MKKMLWVWVFLVSAVLLVAHKSYSQTMDADGDGKVTVVDFRAI
jgi:hypothetical protein